MARGKKQISPLAREVGTLIKQGAISLALGYPASYRVGVCSLGFQTVYKHMNAVDDVACGRFFLPEKGDSKVLSVLETGRPVSDMHAVLFSVACEQELLMLVTLFHRMGIAPLAADRDDRAPIVMMGGPLTTVDPKLLYPFADLVVQGSGEHLFQVIGECLLETSGYKPSFLSALDSAPGLHLPSRGIAVGTEFAPLPKAPAAAVTWSEDAEFRNLFLVEATRGCRRGCTFCTLSRFSNDTPPFHPFDSKLIFEAVPVNAPGVGLVGAAVTDHPEIDQLVAGFTEAGKRVSLSSIRADRLTLELARLLLKSGGRTITLAADGSSEAVRKRVKKGIREQHLIDAVETAREAGFLSLKIYSMVGLPGESEEDIKEYASLLRTLSKRLQVSTTVQAFVPKPNTPLAAEPMLDISTIGERLALLRKETKGKVKVLPTSPKWSFVDWKIAHAGKRAAHMAIAAEAEGGSFAAWKRAIAEYE